MNPLPAQDLRSNLGTWAVPISRLPAVGNLMHDIMPNEVYDPHFEGQLLGTTYFDTQKLELRKNRLVHGKYITLRVRRYVLPNTSDSFALSAKTEDEKFRTEIAPGAAAQLLQPGSDPLPLLSELLPANLYARLLEVSHQQPLLPVVTVGSTRYAVEDDIDRLTLDVEVRTDTGKRLPWAVLEFKSSELSPIPAAVVALGLRPRKLSKFLWALEV